VREWESQRVRELESSCSQHTRERIKACLIWLLELGLIKSCIPRLAFFPSIPLSICEIGPTKSIVAQLFQNCARAHVVIFSRIVLMPSRTTSTHIFFCIFFRFIFSLNYNYSITLVITLVRFFCLSKYKVTVIE